MAAHRINEEVAELLNDLSSYGMQTVSDQDPLRELVIDYFTERGEEEGSSDEEEKEEPAVGKEPLKLVADIHWPRQKNEDDDLAFEGYVPIWICHLADEVFPHADADADDQPKGELLPDCDSQLNDGQPCHTRFNPEELLNVHFPSNHMQPGPIYFSAPRKCGLFGVCCEGLQQQVNYIIDEGMCTDKGSKSVISYLHHFLDTRGRGESHMDLHCDNCSGQNKNWYMLAYLCWRTMTGLHKEITLNFMVAGHTKFTPDRCFGLLKKRFRQTEVNCLADIAKVVASSSDCGINIPEILGSEDGMRHVPVYDRHTFFTDFRGLPGIKKAHHFRFSSEHPGVVFYKTSTNSQEEEYQLFVGQDVVVGLPEEIPAPGLSRQRKEYLAKNIRDFVLDDSVKDLVT